MTKVLDPAAPRFSPRVLALLTAVAWLAAAGVTALLFPGHLLPILVTAALLAVVACLASAYRWLGGPNPDCVEKDMLREVLEGSRGGRMITDAADHPVFVNEKFRQLCASAGAPSIASLAKLFAPDAKSLAHFDALADRAHAGHMDSIILHMGEGTAATWYEVTVQPIAGFSGFIHWRVDDITERRSSDLETGREREKLRDFTDNAPVGFFSVDEAGRFVFVNAALAAWLGRDVEALLSQGRLHDFLAEPPGEGTRPYDIIAPGHPGYGGPNQIAELAMKDAGGRAFMAGVSQAIVRQPDGSVRTRGVVHDLTGERAMRQALQASEDRFERFFAEAPLGIALLNSGGMLVDCNRSLAAVLGFSVEQLEGRQFEALVKADDRPAALEALDHADGGRASAPLEITLIGRDRDSVVQMYARRLEGRGDTVLHFIDLTEQKSLEQQFVQSQKMQAIGQLAGGVAHDFNNLLTAMMGFCDLLLLRHKPGDPSFADIMQIKQNANRAANLVRQLLAFSRQQTLRPRVQDITDILTEVSHLLRRLIGANIDLEVSHGQDLGLVRVDAGQMEQVLINLAVNARDAMETGGGLAIRTYPYRNAELERRGADDMPPGQWVVIEVTDNGTGIPDANLTRIFEPFFTTKEVGQGTGLGLATVYGIVRQTGGYLHVDSIVGRGTTFSIYLPRLSDAEGAEIEDTVREPEEQTGDLTGTALILLVEDEDAVRTFGSRALTNKGYEVLEAQSGEDALDVLAKNPTRKPDLMVTDVIMPLMDGPTLAKHLREQTPNLKIIFISGYTEEKLKDHMGENIWFLPKPFTLKQLAAKVKEALEE